MTLEIGIMENTFGWSERDTEEQTQMYYRW